jgi:hypothetical protein
MHEKKEAFVIYIPVLCTLETFLRQREDGQEACTNIILHKSVLIKYGKTGLLVFPLLCLYEFCTYFRSSWNSCVDIRLLFFNINLDYLLIGTSHICFYITITLISVLDQ